MNHNIQLLECTLRDGGLGLEDAFKNNISATSIPRNEYDQLVACLKDSNVDIVELGSIEITVDDRTRFCIFQNIEELSKEIPNPRNPNQLYVGLYRGPDTPIADIPKWNPSLIDGVRVILRYSELQKSLDFCNALSEKGYKVFIQPMLTMRYTDNELNLIINEANKMKAYALYFVDSYGYMRSADILRFVDKYHTVLDTDIRIGFHAHNNMNLAYSNAITFWEAKINRGIIIDSCAIGMGQGAGNLQTELIVPDLNKINFRYNYTSILKICEIVEKYSEKNAWGYSVTRLLPALYNTAYKFAVILRNVYKFSFAEINEILKNMPNEMRHRYTLESAKELLKMGGYDPDYHR